MGFILLIVILVVIFIAIVFFKSKSKSSSSANEIWPYYAKKPLTQPEQILYFRLVEALPEHIILAQVQLSRFLGVKKGNNYQSWANRINRMSADFVVCNKDSSIVAVIELDDSTHQKADRQVADDKKNKALEAAEIKIVRWQVKSLPDVATIKAELITSS
jgi:hypothetical protein